MFTGIIQATATIREISPSAWGVRLLIDPSPWSHIPEQGHSIAVAGVCLTRANSPDDSPLLAFDAVRQTLDNTTLGTLKPDQLVNLEAALRANAGIEGHIVQGHIDDTTDVIDIKSSSKDYRIRLRTPPSCADWIVPKGSIAIDGVSLTIASLDSESFEVALIPSTLDATTLGTLAPGDRVNIESDILIKTISHLLSRTRTI